MRREIYRGLTAAMLVALVATPLHSQVRRSQPRPSRPTRPSRQLSAAQFGLTPMDSNAVPDRAPMLELSDLFEFPPGALDPNATPEERFAVRARSAEEQWARVMARIEQARRWAEENRNNTIREMLKATDEQWQRIKPKLDLIDRLRAEADRRADPGPAFRSSVHEFRSGTAGNGMAATSASWGSGGGRTVTGSSGRSQAWSFGPRAPTGGSGETTDGRVLCEQLVQDIQNPGTSPADIAQRIAELRRIRSQAQENLARVRKDLRVLITPEQEPALILMGYLD